MNLAFCLLEDVVLQQHFFIWHKHFITDNFQFDNNNKIDRKILIIAICERGGLGEP